MGRFGWFAVVTYHDRAYNSGMISSDKWAVPAERSEGGGRRKIEINRWRGRERVNFMVDHNYWLH